DSHHEQPAGGRGRRRRRRRTVRRQQGPRAGLPRLRLDGGPQVGRRGRGPRGDALARPRGLRRLGRERGVLQGAREGRHAGAVARAPEDVVLRGGGEEGSRGL
ncbi:MAG: hypothetical protein AVDCRST_MAG02-384, partial [uncultured Rubrobacteraceae bacterium]